MKADAPSAVAETSFFCGENRCRDLADVISQAVFITDLNGNIVYGNPYALDFFGYERQNPPIGRHFTHFLHPGDHQRAIGQFRHALHRRRPMGSLFTALRRDGSRRYCRVYSTPILKNGITVGLRGVVMEAERRVVGTAAPEMADAVFSTLFNGHDYAMIVYRRDGLILRVNPAFERLSGFSRKELEGRKSWFDLMVDRTTGLPQTGAPSPAATGEIFLIDRQGAIRICTQHGQSLPEFGWCAVTLADITAEHRQREQLQISEARYRSIVENTMDGIFQSTPDGRYLLVNKAFAQLFGYASPEEMVATVTDIGQQLYPDPQDRERFRRLLESNDSLRNYEICVRRKDGGLFWLSTNVRRVCDRQGNILYFEGTAEDISERKKLENQLLQSQKMEAIGRLAGGIAHDFNNLLTAIIGNAEMLKSQCSGNEAARERLRSILDMSQRAAKLTRQLLLMGRKQLANPELVDLNDLCTQTSRICGRLLGEDIRFTTSFAPDLWPVRLDPAQFEQVVLNLLINARDAMQEGGLLKIETANASFTCDDGVIYRDIHPGDYAMVAVTDSGCGMAHEIMEHIFEPFFSTKPGGSGLGLSIVYSIVKQAGGHISVYSEENVGTTFKLYFPVAVGSCMPAAPEFVPEERAVPRGRGETLLVVEDEADILQLLHELLQEEGYRVIAAASAEEALHLLDKCGERPCLLLTDVVLPGRKGRELAEELRRRFPELRVVFMSGYPDDRLVRSEIFAGTIHFLEKPFSPLTLTRKIREVLDGAETG